MCTCVHAVTPFLRFQSSGGVSNTVWNGDSLPGLSGVWLPSLDDHINLLLSSCSFFLIGQGKPGSQGVKRVNLGAKELNYTVPPVLYSWRQNLHVYIHDCTCTHTHLKSSSKPLTLYMVTSEVAADGTMMTGVRERWSGEREGREEEGERGRGRERREGKRGRERGERH